jgi:carboxymethylenebutenolidase
MGGTTTRPGGDGSFGAWVADGKTSGGPAIVVIQEIFGVNKVMRDIADKRAREGSTAICPDLFWRIEPGIDISDQTDAEREKACSCFKAFNVDKGLEDITFTIARTRAQGHSKVGSVGETASAPFWRS